MWDVKYSKLWVLHDTVDLYQHKTECESWNLTSSEVSRKMLSPFFKWVSPLRTRNSCADRFSTPFTVSQDEGQSCVIKQVLYAKMIDLSVSSNFWIQWGLVLTSAISMWGFLLSLLKLSWNARELCHGWLPLINRFCGPFLLFSSFFALNQIMNCKVLQQSPHPLASWVWISESWMPLTQISEL